MRRGFFGGSAALASAARASMFRACGAGGSHLRRTDLATASAAQFAAMRRASVAPTAAISARCAQRLTFIAAVTPNPAVANYALHCRRMFSSTPTTLAAAASPPGGSPEPKSQATSTGKPSNTSLQGYQEIMDYKPDEEQKRREEEEQQEQQGEGAGEGYLPFPPPLHTINIMSLLLLGNVLIYALMNWSGNDDVRDFLIEHFTLSHENWWKLYPFLTSAFYQEHLLQLIIDGWLLFQFGNTMLGFLGNKRLTFFWALCMLGGGAIHIAKQHVELYYGMDSLEVRGRVYGANPFILGLVGVEGLIFRHLNFMHQPPVPFLVLTAFVMVIDVWRIFTMKPDEHGASTGGALVAYVFWALPSKALGLNKLTAAL